SSDWADKICANLIQPTSFISFRIIKKASASSYFICKTIPKDLFHLPLLSGEVGRETFSVP
ncbi:hypothetical protein, partial [Phocaeicola plebeius]|uniref:hypothetical protein n=1 Tax=Phocaeicola plebeius TaxID=310297 RepID=UPI0026EAFC1A